MRSGMMKKFMRLSFGFVVSIFLFTSISVAQGHWYRGNTHTHTAFSDGDTAPHVVARWYKEHGYHFVVITDHNLRTPFNRLNAVGGEPGKFLVLPGEEVTDEIHMNAINSSETIGAQGGEDRVDMMNRTARAIRRAGGLPHLNHPNFGWAVSVPQLMAATEIKHFELMNAHPAVNNWGGSGSPSTEEIWDKVLSSGRVLYAVGSDDAHHFTGEFGAARANPGRAWVMVKAPELTPAALVAAMDRGDFYVSTGVQLEAYQVTEGEISLELPPDKPYRGVRYRTDFIGRGGAVLKHDESLTPAYRFRGDELYVRARVQASNGALAWTQPVFPRKR